MNAKSIKNRLSAHGFTGEIIFEIAMVFVLMGGMMFIAITTWFYPYSLDIKIISSIFGTGALVALSYFCKVANQDRREYLATRKVTRKVNLTKV